MKVNLPGAPGSGDEGRIRLGGSAADGEGASPGLNTTAMTDVIFILLIFFIALSEIRTRSLELELPSVAEDQEVPIDQLEPTVVEITEDGVLHLDSVEVTAEQMVALLVNKREIEGHEPRIRIRADAEARHGKTVEVLAALGRAGLTRIEIAVQSKS